MHPRLSVHTVGFRDQPAPEIFRALAAAGIRRAGITMRQVELGTVERSISAARDEGVAVIDVVQPVAFDLEDPHGWDASRARLCACLDAARGIGAGTVYTTTGPAPRLAWDDAAARFADAVGPVVSYATSLGVRLAVENTITLRADLGFVHRLSDVVDLAERSGVAIVADLYAAWTERDLEQALKASLPRLAHVQIADFVLGTLTTPDRAVPGDGVIPISRQLRWLDDAGYNGVIELELLGPRIDAEGAAGACRRGVAAIEALLQPSG
jgi:sugar phosphate isomerase/epimerase